MDTRSMNRQLISSGSPYEPVMGFSRAVRVGQHVFVAGTAPVMPEGEELPSDAYGQTKRCLEIIVAALREAGAEPEHVVRTRIFATSAAIFEEVARAHGAVFSETKPACTYVVTQLIDPRWHVEIEAEALVP
jgi:enamine deaminase RidA (YjgF/YER057c/UK114 family)